MKLAMITEQTGVNKRESGKFFKEFTGPIRLKFCNKSLLDCELTILNPSACVRARYIKP